MAVMATPQDTSETRTRGRSRPQRLLVADDEHLVASGIRGHLIELGYAVIGPASSGEEAIALARDERPDMALLDIRMPATDGIDAARIISRDFGIPVIIVSAYSDTEYLEACNMFDTYGYLLKPVSQDSLRVTIEVGWQRWRELQEERENVARLKQRLDDRKIIEQAKWMLVERRNLAEPDAMRLLQRHARNSRRTLVDVARSLVENESLLSDTDIE